MKAILLAAGRGSRMGPLTKAGPKCLTRLKGKSLLDWQIEALSGAGLREIGLVRGYGAGKLERPDLILFDNRRWNETNMFVSLACAGEWLQRDVCIVSYSDIIYPSQHIERLLETVGDIVIAYDREWRRLWEARFDHPLADAETFRINPQGFLTEIGGRANSLEEIDGQYMGLLKFTPAGWDSTLGYASRLDPVQRDRLDMTALLRGLIRSGVSVQTVPVDGGWYEIDSAHDLELYNRWPEPLF